MKEFPYNLSIEELKKCERKAVKHYEGIIEWAKAHGDFETVREAKEMIRATCTMNCENIRLIQAKEKEENEIENLKGTYM